MGLALVRDREKRHAPPPAALTPSPVGPADLVYNGTNSGFVVGSFGLTTNMAGSNSGISHGWESIARGNSVYYGGALAGPITLTVSSGRSGTVVTGGIAESDQKQYRPEVLRKLQKLSALPLDDAAPEGEKEFMDWLNSD
jgi:hypothetical protein